MSSLERRLAALELQNQRLRRVNYGVAAVAVALIGLGAADMKEVIRAKQFEVVNEKGEVVWAARSLPTGAGQTLLYGPDKNVALSAHGKSEGGVMTVINQKNKVVWQVSVDDGQGGVMLIGDGDGKRRWQTRTTEHGAETSFKNLDEEHVLGIGVVSTGALIEVRDDDDHTLFRLEKNSKGGGAFRLMNRHGDEAVVLKSDSGDGGGMILYNESDKQCLIAQSKYEGGELTVARAEKQQGVVFLSTTSAGGKVELANNQGYAVLNMGASTEDHGTFRIYDSTGNGILKLGMAPNQRGGTLELSDRSADTFGQIYPNDAGNCNFYQRGR